MRDTTIIRLPCKDYDSACGRVTATPQSLHSIQVRVLAGAFISDVQERGLCMTLPRKLDLDRP